MKRIVFNLSLPVGVALVGIGVGLQFGLGYGLASGGALVIALTLYIARIGGVSA